MKRLPGRPGGHKNRSGPAVRIGTAPDPALKRIHTLRREAKATRQALDTADFVISRCGDDPPVALLLRRLDAERAVSLAEAQLAHAIKAAQRKLIPDATQAN